MATQLEILRRLEEQRKARERMQSAINVPVGGDLSATPYIMDSFKRSGGWPGQAVDPLFVNSPYAVRVEAERPFDGREQIREAVELTQQDPTYQALIENAAPMAGTAGIGARIARSLWTPGYKGATRKGEMIFGRDEAGRSIRRVAERPGEFSYSGRPTPLGVGVGTGVLAGSQLLPEFGDVDIGDSRDVINQAVQDTFGSAVNEDFSGRENVVSTPEETPTTLEDRIKQGMARRRPMEALGLGSQDYPTEPKSPPKEQVWGKYAQDPAARKKEYLDQLNKIYRNAMILNAIAQLTGGTSQADAYVKMATGKLDAIDKFDSEERMHNIWKEVFFVDGAYAPPGDWTGTYDKVIQLGGTPKEAEELASSMYKKPSEGTSTAAQENFRWYQSLTGVDKEVAAKILRITDKKADEFSASNLIGLISSNLFYQFDEDEQARVVALVKSKIPGFQAEDSPSVPQQVESGETREQYERRVRERYPNASEEDIQETVKAKYG